MTPVAFFAPLKSPDHPTPSGDRALARALMLALEYGSFSPDLASDFRCLDMTGDALTQEKIAIKANRMLPELIARGAEAGWRAWVTYHNYYKAPDLLGPRVAQSLDIPYVQIESTRARKRLSGPWARFASSAETASSAAQLIFYFTKRDAEALLRYAPQGQDLVHLRPFLARVDLPKPSTRNGPMLAAAMMRPGDKIESYRLLAHTLTHVTGNWRLNIAGDGIARADVEAMMLPFGERVQFLGKLSSEQMQETYATASCLVWPGVNEAIGLTFLEAQAAGIPVIAQDRPGLQEVIAPEQFLSPVEQGPKGLARAMSGPQPSAQVLQDHISKNHLLPAASKTLCAGLEALL